MFPRIFIIAHFFDLSRLLNKKAECGEGSDSISVLIKGISSEMVF